MTIIKRNPDRTEHDDFILNVQPHMGEQDGATPIYNADGVVVAWQIKPMFE